MFPVRARGPRGPLASEGGMSPRQPAWPRFIRGSGRLDHCGLALRPATSGRGKNRQRFRSSLCTTTRQNLRSVRRLLATDFTDCTDEYSVIRAIRGQISFPLRHTLCVWLRRSRAGFLLHRHRGRWLSPEASSLRVSVRRHGPPETLALRALPPAPPPPHARDPRSRRPPLPSLNSPSGEPRNRMMLADKSRGGTPPLLLAATG
jgi:hypothetical protein